MIQFNHIFRKDVYESNIDVKDVFEIITSDGTYYLIGERNPSTKVYSEWYIENVDREPISSGTTFDFLMELCEKARSLIK